MTQPTMSEDFKQLVECFIEEKHNHVEDVIESLRDHGFVESEFGAGSTRDPQVLDVIEDEIKRCLLEKFTS